MSPHSPRKTKKKARSHCCLPTEKSGTKAKTLGGVGPKNVDKNCCGMLSDSCLSDEAVVQIQVQADQGTLSWTRLHFKPQKVLRRQIQVKTHVQQDECCCLNGASQTGVSTIQMHTLDA